MFFSFLINQIYLLISYVSNTNSFPKPLSAKEEQHYLELYENGDMNAKDILIERNLRLVAHVAKKYSSTGKDNDDLISIGTIGLIKGISSFKSSKGTKLSTYIARCIENATVTYWKQMWLIYGQNCENWAKMSINFNLERFYENSTPILLETKLLITVPCKDIGKLT